MTTVALRWEEILMPLLQKYKLNITWGDQDLLNIIFHHNPGLCNHMHGIILDVNLMSCMTQTWDTKDVLDTYYQTNKYLRVNPVFYDPYQTGHVSFCVTESLYVVPCQWNYRPDHCIYGSNCQQAEQEGVFILHGNRGVYHDDKQPAFRAVYEAIQKVETVSFKLKWLLWASEFSLSRVFQRQAGLNG